MMTDIEIAKAAAPRHIREVAADLSIPEDALEYYGKYKAKLEEGYIRSVAARPDGKLALVTAISPTPMGEGKTTTTVGLGEAMPLIGKNAIIALREPSLGPVFGIKGGAAGGGYAQVLPMEDINLHFTGDMHAITAANNLLCAVLDNSLQQGNPLKIDTRRILFKRCMDMNDRALRNIIVGLGGRINGVPREDGFQITVASEIMAIFCLASDMEDLKRSSNFNGLDIRIEKHIPVCAGLGGGSSDAAAVLRALNEMEDACLAPESVAGIGALVGSDVPYCVIGGTALAEGRGEILTPLPPLPKCWAVLCKPEFSISTPALFAKIDSVRLRCRPDTQGAVAALRAGDLVGVARRMYNVFEDALPSHRRGRVTDIKNVLIQCGALGASMSGTGPTVFGLFDDEGAAQEARERLSSFDGEVFLAQTV